MKNKYEEAIHLLKDKMIELYFDINPHTDCGHFEEEINKDIKEILSKEEPNNKDFYHPSIIEKCKDAPKDWQADMMKDMKKQKV